MKTILLAEDNKNIREFCRQELQEEGYHVITAKDGVEAVDAVRTQHPDVVILDIRMPRAGGMEVVQQIRRFLPTLPVILFTSYADECLRDRRSELVTACVEKSEDLAELKRAIVRATTLQPKRRWFRFGLRPPLSEGVS